MSDGPYELDYVGIPFGADTLANIDIGGPDELRVSYRFRARFSGEVQSVRPFIIANTERPGYASGSGGVIGVQIVADDGEGLPNLDVVLGSGSKVMDLRDGYLEDEVFDVKADQLFSAIAIDDPVALAAGSIYHVVFENLDADPERNYSGLDLLYQLNTELGPRPDPLEWGVTLSEEGQPWSDYTFRFGEELYTPVLSILMADGSSFGNGYINTQDGPESFRTVDDAGAIEVAPIQVHAPFTSSSWWLRAQRDSGEGAIRAVLTGSDGSTTETLVDVERFPTDRMGWVEVDWSVTFQPEVTYRLLLTSAEGGSLSMHPTREGTIYGFEAGSLFGAVSRPIRNGEPEGWHRGENDDAYVYNDVMTAWTR